MAPTLDELGVSEVILSHFNSNDINTLWGDGGNALHFYITNKDITNRENKDMCCKLVENGININKQTHGLKETPLIILTRVLNRYNIKDSVELIYYLIEHGADLNLQDYYGHTFLHHYLSRYQDSYYSWNIENEEFVLNLIKMGADPYIKNKQDRSLFNFSIYPRFVGLFMKINYFFLEKKLDEQKEYFEKLIEQKLTEQKEQLLHEMYAPDSIGYQVSKDRFLNTTS